MCYSVYFLLFVTIMVVSHLTCIAVQEISFPMSIPPSFEGKLWEENLSKNLVYLLCMYDFM